MSKLAYAIQFASIAHDGQTRKGGQPYIVHPLRVMKLVAMTTINEDVLSAAILHDVIEDCDVDEEGMLLSFGPYITELVVHLTNVYEKKNYPKLNRKERKKREFERLSQCNSVVQTIKICDRIDNISDMEAFTFVFTKKYIEESTQLLDSLKLAHPMYRKTLQEMLKEIK